VKSAEAEDALALWLERSTCWRFASLLFCSPTAGTLAEIKTIAPTLPASCRAIAERLSDVEFGFWGREYHRLLGPGGLPTFESSYDRAAMATRGPAIAEIAGFYRAFAYRLDTGGRVPPDDISVELGFLAYLAFKAAYASHERLDDAFDVTTDAYATFLREHVNFWLPTFLEPLASSDSDFYRDAAAWMEAMTSGLSEQDARESSP